jgi:hypothetical protein
MMTPEELDESLINLLQKGLISIEYNEKLEAVFSITSLGKKALESSNG